MVIDADVLRSAGDDAATDPTSIQCRNLLTAILKICHRAAVDPRLIAEWDKHQSRFSSKWRVRMVEQDKVIMIEAHEQTALRTQCLNTHGQSEKKQNAILKDFHLVEIAVAADRIILSRDATMRDLLSAACERDDKMAEIMWVVPVDEDVIPWLEGGAMPRPDRFLIAFKNQAE